MSRKSLMWCTLIVLVASCMTAPYTGRKQLILVSETEEAAMGLTAYQQVLSEQPRSSDATKSALIEKVGRRIATVAGRPDFKWEFALLKSKDVNAFCLPGGKVAFYEGILPICRDEAGIAVVMGHEVGHAIARHGGERVTQAALSEAGVAAASEWLSGSKAENQGTIAAALGLGVQLGVLLPFSRDHESEADHIGLILIAKAGYDPREAPKFWERMAAASGPKSQMEFMSTHPSDATRIAQLNSWMPEAMLHYEAAKRGETYTPPIPPK